MDRKKQFNSIGRALWNPSAPGIRKDLVETHIHETLVKTYQWTAKRSSRVIQRHLTLTKVLPYKNINPANGVTN